jgi:orotidine-5'-phosphate decarboxylase
MKEMATARRSNQLIVALDYPEAAPALALAEQLSTSVQWFKVGLELYLAAGDRVVHELKRRGHSVFLDLKLHDIPNTVANAIRTLGRLQPDLLTIHATGGAAMMRAAADAARSLPSSTRLLAVTVLTSLDAEALERIGVPASPENQVLRLGQLAAECGIDGMVCSPEEVAVLRAAHPTALLVTPGIRPAGAGAGDQKRTATPSAALEAGASMIVVGRPITADPDPRAAANAILRSMETTRDGGYALTGK